MPSETLHCKKEFDSKSLREIERKFIPLRPETVAVMKNHETATAIEQMYLSSPDEPFSLRLRASANNNGITYKATLKDRGTMQAGGLDRLEVTAPISAEVYAFYAADDLPAVRKIRVEPISDVTIDFHEDGAVQIESESDEQWRAFREYFNEDLIEITGLPEGDNEHRAYKGIDFQGGEDVEIGTILKDILAVTGETGFPVTVHLGGRSGSGKSTIVRELSAALDALRISNCSLSTDDYHRGQSWLTRYNNGQPWQHWDDSIVYDTETMQQDLQRLRRGETITKRSIDWHTVEPFYSSLLLPAQVIIIEGIYANAPEITMTGDLAYELPTPLATCIGRRLLRDMKERPQFANPVESLAYMLTDAEPAYRKQQK